MREKVTKNWNGKSTECPFPDGVTEEKRGREGAAAEPKGKRGDLDRRIDFNVKLLPEVEK